MQTVPSQPKVAGEEEGAKEGRGQRSRAPRELFEAGHAVGRRPAGAGKSKESPSGTPAASKKQKAATAAAPKAAAAAVDKEEGNATVQEDVEERGVALVSPKLRRLGEVALRILALALEVGDRVAISCDRGGGW